MFAIRRKKNDLILIEGGNSPYNGISVNIDVFSLTKFCQGKLIFILSGNENSILDNIMFITKHINMHNINFQGIIINKVKKIEEFEKNYLPVINSYGIKILGIIPYIESLTRYSIAYLAKQLFAKIIVGGNNLFKNVKNIFIIL